MVTVQSGAHSRAGDPDETSGALQDKTRDALRAAQLYYLQDRTMDAIARELRTSRSSVSRLLAHARAKGIVDIQIHSPLEGAGALSAEIQSAFDVSAHIVPVPDSTSEVDRLERVALSAARLLGRFIDSNMVVGIAWGSTLSAISRHLVAKETHNTQFVQLNGAGNTETTGINYSSEILTRFGDAYSASVQQFPVPAFFDDPHTKQAMWRERSTKRVLALQRRIDLALFGLGSPFAAVPSKVYIGGYLEAKDFTALSASGVVGDVATVFFRQDGSWEDIPLNARASGPALTTVRAASRRVCVVSGASKLDGLRGALAGGLVTDLILDEGTARALVARH